MATYYVAEGGTAANKAAATSGTYPGGCMSPAVHNGETFSAGDFVLFSDEGGPIRATVVVPSSGSSGSPITYSAKSGDSPIIYGSEDLTSAAYKWTASGSGTNEYYLEASGGGTPGISEPDEYQVFIDGARMVEGTIGSLADHEWVWGNNDTLGYNTVYIADATGDPDTSGVVIEASQRDNCIVCGVAGSTLRNYVTIDGIDCKYAASHGADLCGSNIISKNLTTGYHRRSGWKWSAGVGGYSCTYCECNNMIAEYNLGSGFAAEGFTDWTPHSNCLITGCVGRNNIYIIGDTYEAGGVKWFGVDDSTIEKSTFYGNGDGGIRLDGAGTAFCHDNIIQFNDVYDNGDRGNVAHVPQLYIEFAFRTIVRYNLVHDPESTTNRANMGCDHTGSEDNEFYGNICWGGGYGMTNRWGPTGTKIYNNVFFECRFSLNIKDVTSVEIKNNISLDPEYYHIEFDAASLSEITSDYNCWGNTGNKWRQDEVGTYDFAGWKTLSGEDANSLGETDPLMTDPDNDDFTLQSESPCIGAADKTLGSPYNIGIVPGSTWPDGVTTADRDDY